MALMLFLGLRVRAQEQRLRGIVTAQRSAPRHEASFAGDGDINTVWMADAVPGAANNRVWLQIDLRRVYPLRRLHWTPAMADPYPAAQPTGYRVLTSRHGRAWQLAATVDADADQREQPVVLNRRARFVRIETTRVGDGTGWTLGLREIWVTEGAVDENKGEVSLTAKAKDGRVTLEWAAAAAKHRGAWRVERAEKPTGPFSPIATVKQDAYSTATPNWLTRYYRVSRDGRHSNVVAAVAAPSRPVAPPETFAFWYQSYVDRARPNSTITRLGDVPFIIGPRESSILTDLAGAGVGLLPYLTLYQTTGWAPVFPARTAPAEVAAAIAPYAFYSPDIKFRDAPEGYVPSSFCRPSNVEYNEKAIYYTACPNSTVLRDAVLTFAHREVIAGVAGFFVDNGFEDDVASRAICRSTAHTHSAGEEVVTAADSFVGLLLELRNVLKEHTPNGLLIVNGGVPAGTSYFGIRYWDVVDARLWEGYLATSYPSRPRHRDEWAATFARSIEAEREAFSDPPRPVFVLSYPLSRQEAFLTFATAKLCNLPWAASIGDRDRDHPVFGGFFGTYPRLDSVRLGRPLLAEQFGGATAGAIHFREYERGIVVVNPTTAPADAVIPLAAAHRYRSVAKGIAGQGTRIAVSLPPESGDVFSYE